MIYVPFYALGACAMFAYLHNTADHPGGDASLGLDIAMSVCWPCTVLFAGLIGLGLLLSGPASRTRLHRRYFQD